MNAHANVITKIGKIYRIKITRLDICLLEQGILCMGPATRSGCGAQCQMLICLVQAVEEKPLMTPEQGAAMISALASILGYDGVEGKETYTEKEIEELINQVKDPAEHFTCIVYQLLSSNERIKNERNPN